MDLIADIDRAWEIGAFDESIGTVGKGKTFYQKIHKYHLEICKSVAPAPCGARITNEKLDQLQNGRNRRLYRFRYRTGLDLRYITTKPCFSSPSKSSQAIGQMTLLKNDARISDVCEGEDDSRKDSISILIYHVFLAKFFKVWQLWRQRREETTLHEATNRTVRNVDYDDGVRDRGLGADI